jgi:hypothetical protein
MGMGPDIMEMLHRIPTQETLKELLEYNTQWAQLCSKKGEQIGSFPSSGLFHEGFKRIRESHEGGARENIDYAYKLKRVAEVLAAMSPNVMDMANAVSNMTLSLVEAALGFDKLASSILPLMAERNQLYGDLALMEGKLKEVQLKCKKLECD